MILIHTRIQRIELILTILVDLRICQQEGARSPRMPDMEGFRARIIKLAHSRLKELRDPRNSMRTSAARARKTSAARRLSVGRT